MNRIRISPLANRPIEPADTIDASEPVATQTMTIATELQSPFPAACPDSSNCCLFVPESYEKAYRYPLLVWLHNCGDDSRQLNRIMPQISLRNYCGVAPQAALGDEHCGHFWQQDPSSIDYAADAVLQAIDLALARLKINRQRIFLAGCGAAGTMAFRVALLHPDLFAGVVSLNGPLPTGSTPLGCWGSSRNVEVFWSHSRESDEFTSTQLCQQLRLLHVAGFSVTVRQYPGAEELAPPTLSDMNRWVMQQSNSTIA